MDKLLIANILGYAAAGIGIVMFLPQAIQLWKTKETKSISLLSFSLLATAAGLWIGYGVIMIAAPIILVNSVLFILSLFIIYLKINYG